VSPVVYRIEDTRGESPNKIQIVHVNRLKKYIARPDSLHNDASRVLHTDEILTQADVPKGDYPLASSEIVVSDDVIQAPLSMPPAESGNRTVRRRRPPAALDDFVWGL